MDKISTLNTIKNVFAALGAKTSDDNYGVALLDKTSGEPKGLMGMSDLASVLGVKTDGIICFVRDTVNKNIDTMLPTSYILEKQPNIQGTLPTGVIGGGGYVVVYITCVANNTSYGYQEYVSFNYTNTGGIKKWHRYKKQGEWQSWTLEFDS